MSKVDQAKLKRASLLVRMREIDKRNVATQLSESVVRLQNMEKLSARLEELTSSYGQASRASDGLTLRNQSAVAASVLEHRSRLRSELAKEELQLAAKKADLALKERRRSDAVEHLEGIAKTLALRGIHAD
ncbi:hypothetical protein [Sphingomicrobium astaxanthinifaciens]|uniref:hypothetical protein n=1 Tax=Sphingomicrobium astaxanthinifaciens TaxID=1227949 RepID=UPI001FCAAF6D|nr:hypothetical protein [Sphingomicrobium astaxanthinifaciens]MCJ7420363.1 hypothetical protein [Sphingomicrobium astaxanthinifaciens]